MPQYAGFWLRFVAYIIDSILVNIVSYVLGLVLGLGIAAQMANSASGAAAETAGIMGGLLGLVVSWIYFAVAESSSWQATPGKKALGLVVTDQAGGRIGFGRATGRFFGKFLSSLILAIGFIMVAFTERKQGLHDMVAGTLVYKALPHEVASPADAFR